MVDLAGINHLFCYVQRRDIERCTTNWPLPPHARCYMQHRNHATFLLHATLIFCPAIGQYTTRPYLSYYYSITILKKWHPYPFRHRIWLYDRHPTHYVPLTSPDRWAVVGDSEEQPGNVRLPLKEGILSHGDWMKASILIKSFRDGDVWSVERLLNRSFWRVGNWWWWVSNKIN